MNTWRVAPSPRSTRRSAPEMPAATLPGVAGSPRFSCSSCFVTGTDTGVGKTLVASALLRAFVAGGARAVGMKPVAAGAQRVGDAWINEDVEQLAAAGNVAVPRSAVCPCILPEAMAPHIAAARAGVRLELAPLVRAYQWLQERADAVVVEGVGGFRVPLGPDFDTADLARVLGLPLVLVVGLRLGCLNHAALTAEAIAARGLRLAGWVANAIDPGMAQPERNIEALQAVLMAPCLGVIPWMEQPDSAQAAHWLDLRALHAAPGL